MFDPTLLPYTNPRDPAQRRVVLITGGNTGIGWHTVKHLYLHGHVVYISGRSRSRVAKSIAELELEALKVRASYTTDQLKERFLGDLHFLEIDLLSLALVVLAVDYFKTKEKYLSILINNAGVMALPHLVTADGFEIQLQTNYVLPFLLTTRLLPLLERTADLFPQTPPRIVYLSLVGHLFAFRYFDMGNSFHLRPNIVFTWFRYGMAKTAGIHLMKMLALRNPRILCMLVHPGFVMNTNLFAYWTRLPIIGILFWCFFQLFGFFFGVSNEEGLQASVRCCLDPSLTLADNGRYYATGGVEAQPSRVARNMDYAARSWIWTVHQLSERNIAIAS